MSRVPAVRRPFRHRNRTSRARAVVACVLLVVVAAGLLGGVTGLDLVVAPAIWVLGPDLATTWQEAPPSPPRPVSVARAAADSPRPPPISLAR